jgi:hypothetical protein
MTRTPTSEEMDKARKYCEEQVAIMDGSLEAGLKRLGTERFENMVLSVALTLTQFKSE